jgi:hypothetical protein
MIGRFLIGFFAVVAVLGIIGVWMLKRKNARRSGADAPKSVTENIADLNDRFNRARYMDQDGN